MIFSQHNEDGVHLCDLVLQGRKTVTRRTKPQPVGAIRAVQRGRGKKAEGRIRIAHCFPDSVGFYDNKEAHREGFKTWAGLQAVLDKTNPENKPLYRIEFELISGGGK